MIRFKFAETRRRELIELVRKRRYQYYQIGTDRPLNTHHRDSDIPLEAVDIQKIFRPHSSQPRRKPREVGEPYSLSHSKKSISIYKDKQRSKEAGIVSSRLARYKSRKGYSHSRRNPKNVERLYLCTDKIATKKLESDNEHFKDFILKTLTEKVGTTKSVQNFNSLDHQLKEKADSRRLERLRQECESIKRMSDGRAREEEQKVREEQARLHKQQLKLKKEV